MESLARNPYSFPCIIANPTPTTSRHLEPLARCILDFLEVRLDLEGAGLVFPHEGPSLSCLSPLNGLLLLAIGATAKDFLWFRDGSQIVGRGVRLGTGGRWTRRTA